jgi:uncharacterized protein involved in outer membrane biogenesis
MKRIIYSFGAIIGLFIGILLIFPFLIDINHYKEKIITEAKEATGRELFIEGPISFSLFPTPSITLHQVMLANHPKAKTPHIATLEKIKVSVAIIPLIQRKIYISKIDIKNPQLKLEKLSKEKMNWEVLSQKNPPSLDSRSLKEDKNSFPFNFIPAVDEIKITNAQVTYCDGKDIFLIENLGLKISMRTLEGPYVAKGKFRLKDKKLEFKLNVGDINELRPIEAQVDLAGGRLKLTGIYHHDEQTFKGKLRGQVYSKAFRSLVPDLTLLQDLNHKTSIDSFINADAKAITLKDLYFDLQSLKIGGDLSMIFGKNINIKAKFRDLPGQGEISFTLEPQSQGLAGMVNIQLQEFKSFLNWLQVPIKDIPSHLLETCKFSMKYAFLGDLIKLTKIDLLLKKASISGDIHYKLHQSIPTIMINLKTPKLENLLPIEHKQSKFPLGVGAAQGHLQGDSKALRFDMKLSLGNFILITKGEASALDKNPQLMVEVDGKITNLRSFLNALGIRTEIASVYASLKGQVSGALDNLTINIKTTVGGLALKTSGVLKNIMTFPAFNFNVDLSHYNFRNFLSIFNICSSTAHGGVTFSTNIKGDTQSLKIENIKGTLGSKSDINGLVEIDWKQSKPMITGNFTSNSLNLDPFIAQAAASQDLEEPDSFLSFLMVDSKPCKMHAWSREPINFSISKDLEANISFSILKLSLRDIIITNLNCLAKTQDGMLDIAPVTGNIYDGSFDGSFQLTSQNVAAGKLELQQANLLHLLPCGDTFKIIGGKFSLSAALKTQGNNLNDMVARLGGQVKIRAKDGVISGFDLKAISQRLKEVNSIPSLLGLLTESMSKGKTTFHNFKSEVSFKNGIGTIQNMELIGYGATSKAKGNIDLLKYVLNVDVEFRLTEHPYLPSFIMHLTGPPNDPKRDLETGALQQYLLKNTFNGMVEDVISGPSKIINMLGSIF